MKRSILYFDDKAARLKLFQEVFGNQYVVRLATTLAQARRALSECAVAVIISEENLPEISGTDFLHEAAETCPQSYCVLVTGEPIMVKAVRGASSSHIHVFIPSPWTVENMRHVLELAEMQFRSGRKRR